MSLIIIRQDITKVKADAIVNPTDAFYSGSGGTDARVHKAAGPKLDEYCSHLSQLEIGHAEITSAFSMDNTHYIIHTRGPKYIDGKHNEGKLLEDCYRNSLELAKQKKVNSVAMPLISTGTFKFPMKDAMKIANSVISDFLFDNDMDIYLLVFSRKAYDISSKLYADVKNYLEDHGIFDDPIDEEEYLLQRRLRNARRSEGIMLNNPPAYTPIDSDFIKNYQSKESFNDCLRRFIIEKNLIETDVYKSANMNKQTFGKIYNEGSIPKKSNVLALTVGMKLNRYETEELMEKAGYSMGDKQDFIVLYHIEHSLYNIKDINEYLASQNETQLGTVHQN